jgi:hypothetical protein
MFYILAEMTELAYLREMGHYRYWISFETYIRKGVAIMWTNNTHQHQAFTGETYLGPAPTKCQCLHCKTEREQQKTFSGSGGIIDDRREDLSWLC